MFKVDRDVVAAMLEEDPSLGTLKNQFTADEVFAMLEEPESIQSSQQLYEALMDVMYATRPKGVL